MKKILFALFALLVAVGSAHAELKPVTTGLRWQFVKNAVTNDGNLTVSKKPIVPDGPKDTTATFSLDGICVPAVSYNSGRTDSVSIARVVVYADSAGSDVFSGQTVNTNIFGAFGSDDSYVLVASYNTRPTGRTFSIPIYANVPVNSASYYAPAASDFNYTFPKMKIVIASTNGSTVPSVRVALQRFDCK